MLNPKEILDSVTNAIPLDLVRGPFVMGSVLTYLEESIYQTPTWNPQDLDISCRTYQQVDRVSLLLGQHYKTIISPSYAGHTYRAKLKMFDHFNINIAYSPLENFSAEQSSHIFSWATVCAICTDGKNYIYHQNSIEDIKTKTLRLTSPKLDAKVEHYKNINQLNYYNQVLNKGDQHSYTKYIARGYSDPGNVVYQQLFGEI